MAGSNMGPVRPVGNVVRAIAWLNFLLAVSGTLKFLPLLLVAMQSTVTSHPSVALRWSIDLISDTHWIVLVWFLMLVFLRHLTGRILIFPWRLDSARQ